MFGADLEAGTIACAVAPTMYTILIARAVAGAGSGGLLTITVSPIIIFRAILESLTTGHHSVRSRLARRSRTIPRRRICCLWRWIRSRRSHRRRSVRRMGLEGGLLGSSPAHLLGSGHCRLANRLEGSCIGKVGLEKVERSRLGGIGSDHALCTYIRRHFRGSRADDRSRA